ncbi:expressed unknown protein [Seminavis robusta]|uniref:Uncharacterized protein n=1 Tax=Seminavis robusta TaxID=568900 RepID=A0A9N8E2M9_9STRA|nr:expressed unknown protein [Seminavis robusta]|eukprot:Sro593_g172221.1  (1001) ;mRNA; r:2980-5982
MTKKISVKKNQALLVLATTSCMQLAVEINEAAKMEKYAANHAQGSSSKEKAENNFRDNNRGTTNYTTDFAMATLATGNEAWISDTPQSHQLSFFPKGQTHAVGMPVKGSATAQKKLEEDDHFTEEEHRGAARYNMDLLQMATEINEAAKMEKIETGNDLSWQSAELAVEPLHRQQHQPSRPGAYMGLPGEALQRATTLQYSLVGASATGQGESLVQMGDPDDSSALAEPHDAGPPSSSTNHNIPSTNDQHLAVADLVLEDPEEEQTRPAADPVDLQHVQQRERKRKKQRLMFILFLVMMLVVAAITVGAVAGTQKKEPEVIVYLSTDAPTVYGSMTPSGVPSSAPTGDLDLLFDSLPDYTLASINNGSETPQWRGWQWLANHQNITFLSDWRKTQLFALATFFYAFEGESWNPLIKGYGWMDDTVEECDWFSSGFEFFFYDGKYYEWQNSTPPCNSQGQFTSLDLQHLQLSGLPPFLPPEIALLTSLSRLSLDDNDIAGTLSSLLPTEFYEMTGLTHLTIEENQITGKIPSEISTMTALTELWLNGNMLTGQVPSELGLLTALNSLEMSENRLTHQIPSELGLLTSLDTLQLGDNQLSGPIFSELGLLTSLEELKIYKNQFTGPFPSELGLLATLKELSLSENQLSGPISSELGLLTTLERLWIDENSMTGPVPSELAKLTALTWLRLNQNQLTGQVPSELGLLTALTVLMFNENRMMGTIPSELGLLTSSLEWLALSNNQLSSQVPSEFGAFTALDMLWLNGNQLTGPVPMEFWLLTSLQELYLADNQFTATIPTEVDMMTSLTSLRLHNNNLTGTLPSQLDASMGLRLHGNQFLRTGTVPEHLCSFLRCDCALNETPPVSTCSDLIEDPPDWPGRFPNRGADVMLNIQTDDYPDETSWVWQKETNVTGVWDTLESAGPLEYKDYLYYSLFAVNADTTYRLVVSDSWGDGVNIPGWITLTATNQSVFYSLLAGEAFYEITIDILVGADGSSDITNSTSH